MPQHQVRGSFKKLTLTAVNHLKSLGTAFIFNTPNKQSKPGYLKMGWKTAGKIKIAVIPVLLYAFQYKKGLFKAGLHCSDSALQQLCQQHNTYMQKTGKVFTPKSAAYLHWRYVENPLQAYSIFGQNDYFVAMYVKKHTYFNELRVSELLFNNLQMVKKQLKQILLSYAREHNCLFITLANNQLFSVGVYGAFGPILTLKQLQIQNDSFISLQNLQNWQYSIGDLELF